MYLILSAVSGGLAVAAGAFGAHILEQRLEPRFIEIWRTAAHYHLIHSVAMLALALYANASGRSVRLPWLLLAVGTLVFSGSLYSLVLTGISKLGAITPLGGLSLIAGWIATAFLLRST